MEILEYTFFRNALWGVIVISIAAAVIGTYIVTRRMVFISGGITHACFGGLGMGYWLGLPPMAGAAAFAVAGALGVDWLSKRRVRQDSAIAVIWALGMALGILFIFLTSGVVPEVNTFLFGNVLTVTRTDLWLFSGFTLALILWYCFFRRLIVAVSFDEAFARTRRMPVTLINTVMTVFVAIAIVLTVRMIGVMLLVSLLSLPQMSGEQLTRRYGVLMAWSLLFSLIGCVGGLFIAYYISVPASAAIVILLIVVYMITSVYRQLKAH